MKSIVELRESVEKIRFYFTSLGVDPLDREQPELEGCKMVVTDAPFFLYNGLFCPRFSVKSAKRQIDLAVDIFHRHQVSALIPIGPLAAPSDLGDHLLEIGFSLIDVEYDLGIDVTSFRIPKFLFNKIKLEIASTASQKKDWTDLFFRNFSLPDSAKAHFSKILERENSPHIHLQCFFGMSHGVPVGTVAFVRHKEAVGIYCVSMRTSDRHRGWGTMLMAEAYRWAQSQSGVQYLVGNSNKAAHRIYTKAPTVMDLGQTKVFQWNWSK